MTVRAAIYYAPAEADPLWTAGCTWLGRDPASGRRMPGPFDALSEQPRLYGFHATLKPPMRPAYPWAALMEGAAALATRLQAFDLPPLVVADIGGFLALRESIPCLALHALADACVTELDTHRVPADAAELAKRRGRGLSPEHDAMLVNWGYPHVLGTWQFHMTLTRRLTAEEREVVAPAAAAYFAAALAMPRRVESICVFTQASEDAPFLLAERLALGG